MYKWLLVPSSFLVRDPAFGWSVAKKFKREGYTVALGNRNPKVESAENEGFLPVKVDLSKIDSVDAAFKEVIAKLGVPNIVVYNGSSFSIR